MIVRGKGWRDITKRGTGQSDIIEREKGWGIAGDKVGWEIESAGFVRTARCLFRGEVFVE